MNTEGTIALRVTDLRSTHVWFYGAILFIVSFGLYYITLAPTLQVGDAGEQITAAHVLGVSHPTGTPLYLIVMKAWELCIPWGSVAWRMNLLNAVLGALSIPFFFVLLLRIASLGERALSQGHFLLGGMLALLWATSRTFWQEATAASSYELHILLVILWLLAAHAPLKRPATRTLLPLLLITGLALSNHIFSLVLLTVTWILVGSAVLLRTSSVVSLLAAQLCLLPGLLFYLLIPFRARAKPLMNWGDPSTFTSLKAYLLRTGYEQKSWMNSPLDVVTVAAHHISAAVQELSIPFGVLVVASVVVLMLDRGVFDRFLLSPRLRVFDRTLTYPYVWTGLALFILTILFLTVHGSHTDIFFWHRYGLTAYLGLFVAGSALIFAALSPERSLYLSLVTGLIGLGIISNGATHFSWADRSNNTLLRDMTLELLDQIPPHATLIAEGDNYGFSLLYFHLVEHVRPDLNVVFPAANVGDYSRATSDMENGNYFTTRRLKVPAGYHITSYGMSFHVTPGEQSTAPLIEWKSLALPDFPAHLSPLEKRLVVSLLFRRATYFLQHGDRNKAMAFIHLMPAYAFGFDDALILTASAHRLVGEEEKANKYLKKAREINARHKVFIE